VVTTPPVFVIAMHISPLCAVEFAGWLGDALMEEPDPADPDSVAVRLLLVFMITCLLLVFMIKPVLHSKP
jgi:hypothetical protein